MTESNRSVQASIVQEVLASPLIRDECEIFYFEREDNVKRYQAVAVTEVDPTISVVFSLPVDTTNVFITASDGDSSIIRKILANLEDINSELEVLLGNVQLFKAAELEQSNISGVILLPIETSHLLDYLPENFPINSVSYKFLLVVFISYQEHKIWLEKGHDALLDYFSEMRKDLVQFNLSSS